MSDNRERCPMYTSWSNHFPGRTQHTPIHFRLHLIPTHNRTFCVKFIFHVFVCARLFAYLNTFVSVYLANKSRNTDFRVCECVLHIRFTQLAKTMVKTKPTARNCIKSLSFRWFVIALFIYHVHFIARNQQTIKHCGGNCDCTAPPHIPAYSRLRWK